MATFVKFIFLTMLVLLQGCGGSDDVAETPTFTVSATAGSGGSISPSSRSVISGGVASFAVQPDAGFDTSNVSGCAGLLNGTTFSTGIIRANCSISASFTAKTYTITATASTGGSISPSSQQIQYGQQATFSVTPEPGYKLTQVQGCNGTLTGNSFVTQPIIDICQVNASFEKSIINITAVASEGGSVSPSNVNINAGEEVFFTITANEGYHVQQVDGCNNTFDGGQLAITVTNEDCQLQVQFNSAEFVVFPDENLAKTIRETLGLEPNAAIATQTLTTLSSLDAQSKNITRLDGLQYATGLKSLNISYNDLLDISILQKLANNQLNGNYKLTSLNIDGTKISDLSPLQELTSLISLSVSYNNISDLSALSYLPLKILHASSNPLTTEALWRLQSLPLTNLTIRQTKIDSLEPLISLSQLQTLDVAYNDIQNLSAIQHLPELRFLYANNTTIVDLSPLLAMNSNVFNYAQIGGCLKLQGFSRPQLVIDTLKSRGVTVNIYNYLSSQEMTCPVQTVIDAIDVTAQLNNNGLQLDWQVQSSDPGPWRCELHLDLDFQLPRIPVAVLDNCHLQQSWQLTDIQRNITSATFFIDTGLFNNKNQKNLGEIINTDSHYSPVAFAGHDWAQAVVKANPYLIPNRDALLRLHLTSAEGATPPMVSVQAQRGSESANLTVQMPNTLPQIKQHGSLSFSYQVLVPAQQMQPDSAFRVSIDGMNDVIIQPSFATANSIDLTVVPFQLGEEITEVPSNNVIEESLITFWPLAKVNITQRQPFQLAASAKNNTTSTMLKELYDLRVIEGGQGYYYGYFYQTMNTDQWGGRGYMPGFASVGATPYSTGLDTTLSHELGHNFSINHAPCGSAGGPDSGYPYQGGKIGSYGVPVTLDRLLAPEDYNDLMGYCGNNHVSDYNFELVQDYLQKNIANPAIHQRLLNSPLETAAITANDQQNTSPYWYYRMATTTADKVELQQLILLEHQPLVQANSAYKVLAWYNQQSPKTLPVEQLVHGHGDEQPELIFVLPTTSQNISLTRWSLYHGDTLVYEHHAPVRTANVDTPTAQSLTSAVLKEHRSEVCVNAETKHFDAMNLLWRDGKQRLALALNVTEPTFCRNTADIPSGGTWQLQLRTGAQLELIEYNR